MEQTGTAVEILTSVIGGNTHYYVRVEGSAGYLDFNAAEDPIAALLAIGDRIQFACAADGLELEPRTIVPASRLSLDGGAVE